MTDESVSVASINVWMRTMGTTEGSQPLIQTFQNKCIRKLMIIPWAWLMTYKQVYRTSKTEGELFSHEYIGHVMTTAHEQH